MHARRPVKEAIEAASKRLRLRLRCRCEARGARLHAGGRALCLRRQQEVLDGRRGQPRRPSLRGEGAGTLHHHGHILHELPQSLDEVLRGGFVGGRPADMAWGGCEEEGGPRVLGDVGRKAGRVRQVMWGGRRAVCVR
jgi:hypothetical protein